MLIVNNFNIKCWQYLPPQVGKATYPGERAVQFFLLEKEKLAKTYKNFWPLDRSSATIV